MLNERLSTSVEQNVIKIFHCYQHKIAYIHFVCLFHKLMIYKEQSRYAPSQWETPLKCNDVSHWLSAYLDWSLDLMPMFAKCHRKFWYYSLRIKCKSKSPFKSHWNSFLSKSSMELPPEFHGTFLNICGSMELEQHKLKFHGNSIDFFSDPKFQGIPGNLFYNQSSMELHGIAAWNF